MREARTIKLGGIEWLVVGSNHDMALLVSKECVSVEPFDIPDRSWSFGSKWSETYLNKWLNTVFIRQFDAHELGIIIRRKVMTLQEPAMTYILDSPAPAQVFRNYIGRNIDITEQYIFIPSYTEITKIWKSWYSKGFKIDLRAKQSDICSAWSNIKSDNISWWLRDNGMSKYGACYVDENGNLNWYGAYKGIGNRIGVRPAIYVPEYCLTRAENTKAYEIAYNSLYPAA